MSDDNGNFTVITPWLAEASDPLGMYTATISAAMAPAVVLASATFVITDAGAAAVPPTAAATPRTGGGGTARRQEPTRLVLLALGAIALSIMVVRHAPAGHAD